MRSNQHKASETIDLEPSDLLDYLAKQLFEAYQC